MPAIRECPMCGGHMRPHEREVVERVPGTSQTSAAKVVEWVCPECDYFESAEEGAG